MNDTENSSERYVIVLIVHQANRRRDEIVVELVNRGFDVLRAENELQAQRILQSHTPDGVLIQHDGKSFDGISLLEKIKKSRPKLPCLVLSEQSDISIEDTFDKGAEAVFFSTMNPEIFALALSRHLSGRMGVANRQYTREQFRKDVRLSAPFESGTIVNIGRGGMFVSVSNNDLPSVGSTVEFEFNYGPGNPVKIEGTGVVRWVRHKALGNDEPAGYGVEFVSISEESRGELFKMINALTTTAYIPKGKNAV